MLQTQLMAMLTTIIGLSEQTQTSRIPEEELFSHDLINLVPSSDILSYLSNTDEVSQEQNIPPAKPFDPHTDVIAWFPPRRTTRLILPQQDPIDYCPDSGRYVRNAPSALYSRNDESTIKKRMITDDMDRKAEIRRKFYR